MISEKTAKKLETDIEWNGRANVCVHCGKVPETFYVTTGHDHTDYDIRWCPCREPNHNWCAGCSPDNCSGCGAEPVAEVVWFDPALRYEPEKAGKIIDGSIAFMESAPLGTKLHTTPQPDRVAELEAETTKLKLDLLTSYGEAEELSGKVAELEDQIAVLQEQIDLQIPAGVMIAQMKRIAELEAALKVAREALDNCAADYLHADSVLTDSALAKINEVLKP